jgi:Ice-binding-like
MKTSKRSVLSLLLFFLPACGGQLVEFPQGDAGKSDTTKADVLAADGVNPNRKDADVTNADVVRPDVANADIANADIANTDAANADAATTDAANGNIDEGTADARNRDNAGAEVATVDSRVAEAGNPDARKIDAPIGDGRTIDVPIIADSTIEAPVLDSSSIDAPVIDVAKRDAASIEAKSIDLGNIDGSGQGPAIVINMGLARPFAIAATAGVTNTITAPITHINGDVVLTPDQTCNAVTVDNAGGFGLCDNKAPTISGTVITNTYPDTTTASAIKADLNAAFLSITPLAGPPAVGSLGGGTPLAAPTTLGDLAGNALVLGDNWFTPGVYTSITSILITDDVTLDGQGDPNAIFIFQSASTLTTADGAPSPAAHARILLTNGTKASNVWWQVASSATIGLYSEFQGNILAAYDITMKTGSAACGRSMAGAWVGGSGAFVFDSNVVSVPGNGCPL